MSFLSANPLVDDVHHVCTKPRVLICATGSVATVKIPELVVDISQFANVRVVVTKSALHFLHCASTYNDEKWRAFEALGGLELVSVDEHEWANWRELGDSVVHIDMCKWADVLLIAPASANSIAKMAHGIADNLVTNIVRAWDNTKPMIICPAMNTIMWEQPITRQQLSVLVGDAPHSALSSFFGSLADIHPTITPPTKSTGTDKIKDKIKIINKVTDTSSADATEDISTTDKPYVILIEPVVKQLSCGDVGIGALAAVDTIVSAVWDVTRELANSTVIPSMVEEEPGDDNDPAGVPAAAGSGGDEANDTEGATLILEYTEGDKLELEQQWRVMSRRTMEAGNSSAAGSGKSNDSVENTEEKKKKEKYSLLMKIGVGSGLFVVGMAVGVMLTLSMFTDIDIEDGDSLSLSTPSVKSSKNTVL